MKVFLIYFLVFYVNSFNNNVHFEINILDCFYPLKIVFLLELTLLYSNLN